MIKKITSSTLVALALLHTSSFAKEIEVKITNVTSGIYFTPLLVSAHTSEAKLFKAGTAASLSLQKMAEGGDISGLEADLNDANANSEANPAGGLLAPGKSTTVSLSTDTANDYLSIVAMMLPTNDGFIALNSIKIPDAKGVYTFGLNAHDAGTEANDEIINGGGAPDVAGIPADPSHTGGTFVSSATGVSSEKEGFISIHRGSIGDLSETGGVSDLDAKSHRFLNPVASVTIEVK